MQGIISAVTVGIPATKVVCKPKEEKFPTLIFNGVPIRRITNIKCSGVEFDMKKLVAILNERNPILKDMPKKIGNAWICGKGNNWHYGPIFK